MSYGTSAWFSDWGAALVGWREPSMSIMGSESQGSRSPWPWAGRMGRDGEFLVGLGVVALGLFFLIGSFQIHVQPTYATIGPRFFPIVVGVTLTGCGVITVLQRVRALAVEAPRQEAEPEGETRLRWRGFLTVAAALLLYILLLGQAGFTVASTVLFATAASGLGQRALLRNLMLGLILSVAVYLVFARGLGLYLPDRLVSALLG